MFPSLIKRCKSKLICLEICILVWGPFFQAELFKLFLSDYRKFSNDFFDFFVSGHNINIKLILYENWNQYFES